MRNDACGWVLMEAVILGCIVLSAAAVLGIFARSALLEEQSAARMDAAFLARQELSVMEAGLEYGSFPAVSAPSVRVNDVTYTLRADVVRQGDFYDVTLHLSWRVLGHMETADYVRRMKRYDTQADP